MITYVLNLIAGLLGETELSNKPILITKDNLCLWLLYNKETFFSAFPEVLYQTEVTQKGTRYWNANGIRNRTLRERQRNENAFYWERKIVFYIESTRTRSIENLCYGVLTKFLKFYRRKFIVFRFLSFIFLFFYLFIFFHYTFLVKHFPFHQPPTMIGALSSSKKKIIMF